MYDYGVFCAICIAVILSTIMILTNNGLERIAFFFSPAYTNMLVEYYENNLEPREYYENNFETRDKDSFKNRTVSFCVEIPQFDLTIGCVTEMNIYPIRFGPPLRTTHLKFTKQSIRTLDKIQDLRNGMFLVYNKESKKLGTFLEYMSLSKISVNKIDTSHIVLDAPGMPSLIITITDYDTRAPIYIPSWLHSENIKCHDCGKEAHAWLNKYLTGGKTTNLYLLQINYSYVRKHPNVIEDWEDYVLTYADVKEHEAIPYHVNRCIVMTKSTYDTLRRSAGSLLDSCSIRPNIIISALNFAPFAEEKWRWIMIGKVIMRKIKPVPRYRVKGNSSKLRMNYIKDTHFGIYYAIHFAGDVKRYDNVRAIM